jgi:hypothetical protein
MIQYIPVALPTDNHLVSDCQQREQARLSNVRQRQAGLERELRRCPNSTDPRACQLQQELTDLIEKDREDRGKYQAEVAALQQAQSPAFSTTATRLRYRLRN